MTGIHRRASSAPFAILGLLLAFGVSVAFAEPVQVSLTVGTADDVAVAPAPTLGLQGLRGGVAEFVFTVQGPAQLVTLTFPLPDGVSNLQAGLPPDVMIVPNDRDAHVEMVAGALRVSNLGILPGSPVEVRVRLRVTGEHLSVVCAQGIVTDSAGVEQASTPRAIGDDLRSDRSRDINPLSGRACNGLATGFLVTDPAAPPAAIQ